MTRRVGKMALGVAALCALVGCSADEASSTPAMLPAAGATGTGSPAIATGATPPAAPVASPPAQPMAQPPASSTPSADPAVTTPVQPSPAMPMPPGMIPMAPAAPASPPGTPAPSGGGMSPFAGLFGGGGGSPFGGGGTPITSDAPPPVVPNGSTCLKTADSSYGERGPYKVAQMDLEIGSQGMYTIFYPDPLEEDCPHPIVAWGNGTGVTGSGVYAFFNENAAAWGMVVAAAHDSNTGSGAFHTEAIEYLLKENENPSSMFYQKLSTAAGTSGHSQGGFGASAGARHPNVVAQVSVGATGTSSAKLSVLILTGTEDIVSGADQLIMRGGGKGFAAVWDGGDHVTTETLAGYIGRDPGSLQMQRLYAAWFRCFLAGDDQACALFEGVPDTCGICNDPGWATLAGNML